MAGAPGRPRAELTLSDEERDTLRRWARRPKSAQALALRAGVVLACADGASNTEVAARLGVNQVTVGKWRARFVERRLIGLSDEPRPGQPRKISDEQVEAVIVTTLESKPVDATHWSTRSMAAATGLNQTAISRIWRAFGLKPHLQETFKLSTDPQFVDKVRDIVGLYLNPPEAALVLCVDEKTQVQALDRSAPVLPMMPGTPERVTHDYLRAGTTDLFAALDVATGKVITQMTAQHRAAEFKGLPGRDRQAGPRPAGRARHLRQPVDPQDRRDPPLAGPPPPLPPALHPDRLLLAQPRRTLVRRNHHEAHPPRRAPLRRRPQRRHRAMGQALERQSQALRVDKDCRSDPRIPSRILSAD